MLDLFCDAKMMVLLVNCSMVRQSVVQVVIFVISITITIYNDNIFYLNVQLIWEPLGLMLKNQYQTTLGEDLIMRFS